MQEIHVNIIAFVITQFEVRFTNIWRSLEMILKVGLIRQANQILQSTRSLIDKSLMNDY